MGVFFSVLQVDQVDAHLYCQCKSVDECKAWVSDIKSVCPQLDPTGGASTVPSKLVYCWPWQRSLAFTEHQLMCSAPFTTLFRRCCCCPAKRLCLLQEIRSVQAGRAFFFVVARVTSPSSCNHLSLFSCSSCTVMKMTVTQATNPRCRPGDEHIRRNSNIRPLLHWAPKGQRMTSHQPQR